MSSSDNTPQVPLTRRQLREMRQTGVQPVIPPTYSDDPEGSASAAQSTAEPGAKQPEPAAPAPAAAEEPPSAAPAEEPDTAATSDEAQQVDQTAQVEPEPVVPQPKAAAPTTQTPEQAGEKESQPAPTVPVAASVSHDTTAAPTPTVNAGFGKSLLEGEASPRTPNSFDDVISRPAPAQHPAPAQDSRFHGGLTAPVAATGETLITGTFELPGSLASKGDPSGRADGKDVDASIVDAELAPASSPTPIAASSAISTIKSPGEVIKAPTPEKGSKLMLTLAITAGILAVALAGALVVAYMTGAL